MHDKENPAINRMNATDRRYFLSRIPRVAGFAAVPVGLLGLSEGSERRYLTLGVASGTPLSNSVVLRT